MSLKFNNIIAKQPVAEWVSEMKAKHIKLWVEDESLRYKAPKGVVSDEILRDISARKSEIIEYIRAGDYQDLLSNPIPPAPEREYYPLSSPQRMMFVLSQIDKGSIAYNLTQILKISGNFDKNRLIKVIEQLIARHESLRTSFRLIKGEPAQIIDERVDFQLDYEEADWDTRLIDHLAREFVRPYDLSKPPLFRFKLLKIKSSEKPPWYLLIQDMHHIISDGVSEAVLVNEVNELYVGKSLPALKVQYKDYTLWQENLLASDKARAEKDFWLGQLGGQVPVLNLATDYPRPSSFTFQGDTLKSRIDQELSEGLYRLTRANKVTLFTVLLTAYNILLSKYTGQEDIVIGSPTAGRRHADLFNLIGVFVNTLALRNCPRPEISCCEFIREIGRNVIKAFDNQDYPFEKLVDELNIPRDPSRNPIFDAMFVLQNMDVKEVKVEGVEIFGYEYHPPMAQVDMTLIATESGQGIDLEFNYCTGLFKKETMTRLAGHYQNILREMVRNPEIKLADINMLSEEERRTILVDFNNTRAEYPREKTIQQLFEEQVKRTPEKIAVIFEGERLTYRELNAKANTLARVLRSKGVKRDSIVALLIERSLEMSVGIIAVLKAGGAYLPISPEYPEDRIRYMLEDSGATLLLTTNFIGDKLRCILNTINTVNLNEADLYQGDTTDLTSINASIDLAYIIYTSGSTGQPKGAMIEHRSLVNRLHWMQRSYPIGQSDVILQKTSYTFDVSVWELLWWSIEGAAVCFLRPGGEKEPQAIIEAIEKNGITTMHFVPSMLNTFLEYISELTDLDRLKSLKQVFASGEALTLKQVKQFNNLLYQKNGTKLHNLYGPTEATIDVSYFNCSTGEELAIVPIGKPIDNIELYILDRNNKLQPVGVPGELCIAGDGLARGYLNRRDLTAEKFVANPFRPSTLMYRTGDLAKWMLDGNIDYLGRLDHQVKIRGFRIELGEIETQLLKYGPVKEVAVIDREDETGNKYLCAYVTSDKELETTELKRFLSQFVPDYMIPSFFIKLDKLPLTLNGKLDRKALPRPDDMAHNRVDYVAPRNELEKTLCGIWAQVLKVEKVGIDDDFLELGGNSLLAIMLEVEMEKVELYIKNADIFKYRTIRKIVALLRGEPELEAMKVELKPHIIDKKPFNGIKLDIKPVHYDFLTCLEDIVVSVAQWAGYRYELALSEVWSFNFNPPNSEEYYSLGESLEVFEKDLEADLAKYHGIKVILKEANSFAEFIEVLRLELENGRPVLVSMDSFLCPWDWNFQKRHISHTFLISGLDDSTSLLYCCDGFYQTYGIISKDELKSGFDAWYGTFSLEGAEEIQVNWGQILGNAIQQLKTDNGSVNAFNSMRRFADVLENTADIQNEIQGFEDNLFEAPFVKKLEKIAYGRRKFAKMMDYFAEETGLEVFAGSAADLERAASQWANVRALLIKEVFSKDGSFKTRALVKIREIADLEEDIANRITWVYRNNINAMQYFSNRYQTHFNTVKAENIFATSKIALSDLTPYFNNKAFGKSVSIDCRADLTGTGIYFLMESPPGDDIWKAGVMEFKVPDLLKQANDNISCNGQKVRIGNDVYQRIMILGCAEWGSFSDKIIVNYINGQVEEINVKFTEWLYKPMYGEIIAWEGNAVERIGDNAQLMGAQVHMIAQKYDLKLRNKIDFLQLPDCPGMHIFAISAVCS